MDERIYSKDIIEFVTVSAEYCAFIERTTEMEREEFVDKITKLLPLLYLKASLLSPAEPEEEGLAERFVTETDYEQVRMGVENLLGEQDCYLEVFHEDMAYSETPVAAHISEGLADIYQALKDFTSVFQLGHEPQMLEAIYLCYEDFTLYWGQQVVNVLRALHYIRYNESDEDESHVCDDDCDCGHHHHEHNTLDILGHQHNEDNELYNDLY